MDTREFEEIVEQYTGFVYNIAYRMMGNGADAEEVVQEAFLSAYRAWDRFRGEAAITTWLYRIAVNAALMRLRKEKKARQFTETGYEDVDLVSWAEGPEGLVLNTELREVIQEGLARLPPDLRAAVVLRDIQQLSTTEAAEALGLSVPALKARLHRGRVLLRGHLDAYQKSGRG